MNIYFFFKLLLISYFTIFQLSAEENMSSYITKNINHGSQTYGAEVVEEIQANGYVKLNGTTVTTYLQVNGRLEAENSQIEKMQVNGQATIHHCLIKQKSIICGALIAKNSTFTDELSISSEKVTLDSCSLTSLHILKVGGYFGVQIVELKGSTQINGPIIFQSGNGEVIADPNCEIIGGVIGGKIRK